MFKSLAFCIAFLSGALLLSAQTVTNYTDNSRPDRAVSSPEARAEAKRLYKEGVKYGLAGLFPQAVEILQRVVKLDPQFADAHYALGHAYFDLKQWRNAIESLKAAVELNPKDSEARDRLGLARAMLWEEDNARLVAQRPKIVPKPSPQTVQKTDDPRPEGQQVAIVAKVSTPPAEETPAPAEEVNAAANESALTKIYRVGPSDV